VLINEKTKVKVK